MADIKWSAFPSGGAIVAGDQTVGLRAGANVRLTANTFGNLSLSTNTLSSTNSNGNINLVPNGTGVTTVGTSTSTGIGGTGSFIVAGTSVQPLIGQASYSNGSSGFSNVHNMYKSRGASVGSQVAVVSGDTIGSHQFYGSDGTNFLNAATIVGSVSGAVSAGIVPGQLVLRTANTLGAMTTAITISNAQVVTLANALPVTSGGTGQTSALVANNLIYAVSTTAMASLATANNGVLITSAGGVPSISSTLPSAVQTNITGLGNIAQNIVYSNPGAAGNRFLAISGATNTFDGTLKVQAGGGSAAFGGGLNLFGHAHATYPGWVMAGISSGSGGSFAVNTQGIGAGTNVFTVSSAGAVVASSSVTATSFSPSTTSGIIGTTTNNDAAAGSVGEILSTVVLIGSPVSLTTATPANIATLSVTAGDWDVWGEVWTAPDVTTTTSSISAAISATIGTLPTVPAVGTALSVQAGFAAAAGTSVVANTGSCRVSLSGTTTYYLVASVAFAISTLSGYGVIRARRRR